MIDEQHGFLKGKSTTTNLFVLTEYVINCFEKNIEVDCIYIDLKRRLIELIYLNCVSNFPLWEFVIHCCLGSTLI
jgi:hypothetical protein